MKFLYLNGFLWRKSKKYCGIVKALKFLVWMGLILGFKKNFGKTLKKILLSYLLIFRSMEGVGVLNNIFTTVILRR
jgi:hypothetical protein